MARRLTALRDSGPDIGRLVGRYGLYVATAAVLIGLKWRGGYDLDVFIAAGRDVAAGRDPYATTLAAGVSEWGNSQVYVSPPVIAHLLAPFADAPKDAIFIAWTIASVLAVLGATRLIAGDTFPARAPKAMFMLVYVWASVFLGQVNLFVLAGLLLALGSRRDPVAGLGLSLAVALRGSPAAFAVVLVIERRWKALAWAAVGVAVAVMIAPGEWLTFLQVGRAAAGLPTLDVPVQTSVAALGPLPLLVVAAAGVIVLSSAFVPHDRGLLAGTAIGLALILVPSNAWYHWLAFSLAPLLLFADAARWSRYAFAAFVAVSFLPMGWPSTAVALAVTAAMLVVSLRNLHAAWPLLRPKAAGILGRP